MWPLVPEVIVRRQAPWRLAAAVALGLAVGALGMARVHDRDARLAVARAQMDAAALGYARWLYAPDHATACPTHAQLATFAASAIDPWGHPLRVVCAKDVGAEYLASDGPDGQPGTLDDLRASPDVPAR